MTTPWPFAQWGLDIMGPFPTALRQQKFLVVGIDYFTKWVEAKPLATITEKSIRTFVWRNIICRYGIPRVLVSNNGKQFDNSVFRNFCLELGIKNHYSSLAHPQVNGQVEVMNRTLLKIIKTPGSRGQRVSGLTNYQTCYGRIGRLQGHPQERPHSDLHTKLMQSSQQRSASPVIACRATRKTKMKKLCASS